MNNLIVHKNGLQLKCEKLKQKDILGGETFTFNFALQEHNGANELNVPLNENAIDLLGELILKVR